MIALIEVECWVMKKSSVRQTVSAAASALILMLFIYAPEVRAAHGSGNSTAFSTAAQTASAPILVPRETSQGLDLLFSGDPDAAIEIFHRMEISQPNSPLGYLLEAEARWWKLYCAALEFKWGHLDAWHRGEVAEDAAFLRLADKAVALAESELKQKETAEMHLYAGMGYADRARLMGLSNERRATARAGVAARAQLLRAKDMDPQLADADTGLGLYNYYVDTLSAIAKILRVFMGIPGGSKADGIKQLENAEDHAQLTAVEARFYLSKNLRSYDLQYERAIMVMEPLAARYPKNAIFQLMLGNLNALLNRKDKAAAFYHSAEAISAGTPASDSACKARLAALAKEGLSKLNADSH
jgi:hypothetical protein